MKGKPRSRFYQIAHRIARRGERPIRQAFLAAVAALRAAVDEARLQSALVSGELAAIEAAAGVGVMKSQLQNAGALELAVYRTAVETGTAAAGVLSGETGFAFTFDATRPAVALAARSQTATLVAQVDRDVRRTISLIVARGAERGLSPVEQSRLIRLVTPLRPSHALAPARLGDEIRAGQAAAATKRRLSASDKAQIRSRIANETVTEEFVREMETRYTRSLLNRRAQDIARTESLRAAHIGQRDAWTTAVADGVLSPDARRVPVVTPDDRLRDTHAEVPHMNIGGVGLEEPFDTPWGPRVGPPWEPLCRCGEGLIFPGQPGVL